MSFSIFKTAILATWISVPLSTLGAYLRGQSPLLNVWLEAIHRQYDDLPGAGLMFLVSWEYDGVFYLIYALLITVGMVVMWATAKHRSCPAQIISLAIALVSLLAALKIFASIWWTDLSYGFYVLAVGKLLLLLGLVCSVVSLQYIYQAQR